MVSALLLLACGDDDGEVPADVGGRDAQLEDGGSDAGDDAATDALGDAAPIECTAATWEGCVYQPEDHPIAEVEGYFVEQVTFRRRFPILVRYPTDVAGPLPVVLASHGGTFNDSGHTLLRPWGRTLAQAGYAVIHMAHLQPDDEGLMRFCMELGVPIGRCSFDDFSPQVAAKAIDAVAVLDDADGVGAWFETETGMTLDLSRAATVGWSGGSQTGMTLLGAVRNLDDEGRLTFTLPDARVVGALALSVQGPGFSGYFEGADGTSMDGVVSPLLIGTGDNDYKAAANPDLTPAVRRTTYENLPGADGQQRLFYSQLPLDTGGHETYHLDDLDHEDEQVRRASFALQSVGRAFMDATLRGNTDATAYLDSTDAVTLAGPAELLQR